MEVYPVRVGVDTGDASPLQRRRIARPPQYSSASRGFEAETIAEYMGYHLNGVSQLEILPPPDGFYINLR